MRSASCINQCLKYSKKKHDLFIHWGIFSAAYAIGYLQVYVSINALKIQDKEKDS